VKRSQKGCAGAREERRRSLGQGIGLQRLSKTISRAKQKRLGEEAQARDEGRRRGTLWVHQKVLGKLLDEVERLHKEGG